MKPSSNKNTSVFPHGHIDRSKWKRVKLGDLGYTYNGLSGKTKQDFDTGDAFYIPFLNVLENTEIDINNLGRVKVSALEKQVCVQKSDLFFNTSSETPEEVGMCAYLSQELSNTFLNSFCFGFRLYDKCAVDPRFLTYLFNSVYGRRVISSLAQGVTRYNLSKERLLRSEIHLPPITEQHRIANCVNIVEENIVETNTLISKYEAIKKATVNLLLKQKQGWRNVKLGDVLKVCHGKCQHLVESEAGLFPILATSGEIGRANQFLYDKPSVLIGRKGTIDKPQYIETPFWTIDTLFYTKIADGYIPKFVFYLCKTIDWASLNEASGVPSLSANRIESIEVCVPQNMHEQKRIVAALDSIYNTLNGLKTQLEKSQAIKQGMMSYFFG